ncbi:hypothetical protein CTheo_4827 [Ceratobasidium theobromae]|uniref:Small nuclear ribonucleoprotein Prp3 C-terminal domain-containing protein n=1 Tax=Ceratobasidium theobromae TaxID=1582974 RepID=A0A5N5QJK5_9AGAM|nr:hypothetical protein CTheo_4827 [Ceratobasidium theobromae]
MALGKAVLEAQQSIAQRLSSMFHGPGELEMDPDSQLILASLTEYLDDTSGDDDAAIATVPPLGNVRITIHIEVGESQTVTLTVVLYLRAAVPIAAAHVKSQDPGARPPLIEISIKHPSWLSRATYQHLVSLLPPYTGSIIPDVQGAEDGGDWIAQIIELVDSEDTKSMLLATSESDSTTAPPTHELIVTTYTRAWFYLPSLSTRSKRDDMVKLASKYNLTGFVLAGKPGLLCVETSDRDPAAPDTFIAELKTVSWADIPSHQKKITERHREFDLPERTFEDMHEITEMISTRGARANRGNMGEVRAFLEEKGLKGVLEIVIGANEFK